ncbi:disease resistance protein RGA5-like [Hordeum vulgare subsp. vulgare]|nr:disease resistance protein RGA5-like [Hordeum vulgare subsp. vulgare]
MDAPYSPRGLQGPRPPRLKVRQESHAIKKPSGAPEQSQAQGHGRLEQQRRQAVRIDANPSFRELVQYLSGGVPASDSLVHQLVGQGSESQTQDFQIVEAGEWQPSLPSEQLLSAAISPAGRLASTDRSLRPVPTRPPDVIDLTDDRFEDGGLAGIADDDWLSLKGALPSSPPPDSTSGQFLPQGPKSVKQLKQTVSDISHEVHSQVKQACHTKKRTQQIQAPVCAMADAMFRLPEKLDALLASHGQTLPRGAEEEIPLIKQDLEKMVAILQEHDDSGAEDRAMTAKCLAKEVRELSYDMEDSVDQYEQTATTSKWIAPRLKKQKFARRRVTRLPVKLRWRLWMANKIREFSLRSQEALQRYSLFNHHGDNAIRAAAIGGTGTSTPPRHDASFGSWYPTPYEELVGIGEHVNNLEAWLGRDGEQRLKVVTVVGSGGIGKSTLVKELYRRMKGQFECRAFVRTSRKPNIRRLLINMLSQVRPHQTSHTWKLHSLIADIRTHLQDKRYLIVIDDVWATQTWDIVNRALPDGNLYSGILITTEIDDVALKCGGYDSKYVLPMKPLCHDDSRKLFFRTAFGPQYECPPELSEVANNIIRKCAGFPLAVVTIAGLLVNQMGKPEQWDFVNKSLGHGLRTNPASEGMKQVLNLSYNNLRLHLKACLMYLSIYEEDYMIQKNDLVKQWIAEGFIHATEEKDMVEISRICFDDLISSRMIQPAHINDTGDVLSCTVHHMVVDFITHKSLEENFVTAIDHCQTTARLADKVRRLSLHFGNAEVTPPTNMRLLQVRTLAFFGVIKCLPSIVEFGLLRILILHLWGDDESISFDLTGISELFRLRYLHVTCNATLEVPQTQIRGLRYLETLKIDARVSAVPSDIVHLPGLLHLSLPVEAHLPNGIGCMTLLCTLECFDISVNSVENVHSLGELTNLRDLRLICSTVHSCYLTSKMDGVCSILTKLSNLRSLTLEPSSILDVGPSSMIISCDGLSSVSSPPACLQTFEWLPRICTFSSLPKWIGHLSKLCILKIGVRKLTNNDFDILRGLPALTVLSLYIRTKPAKRILFNKIGFSVLKYFKFRCRAPSLEFEVDAMPNLLKLKLHFDAHRVDQHGAIPVGIVHLTGLKEISAKIGGVGVNDPDRRAAELALIDAIKMHPARPTFSIHCLDAMFSGEDDDIKKEDPIEHMTLQKQYDVKKEDSIERMTLQKQCGIKKEDSTEHTTLQEQYDIKKEESTEHMTLQIQNDIKKEESTEHMTLQIQNDIKKEDSNKQHGVLQKDYRDDGNKHAHGRRTLPKWSTQVRVSSLQDIEGHDDGFSWRKYGQKDILGSRYPRRYYRCKHRLTQGCKAVKQLQATDGDPLLFNAMYVGNHICIQRVNLQPQPGHEQSTISVGDKAEGSMQRLEKMPLRKSKRSIQVRMMSMQEDYPADDGYSWSKYGQMDILGSKHPRCYYRCVHKHDKGCQATKQVQRSDSDTQLFDIVYHGEHTCAENVHSQCESAHLLLHHISASMGLMPPATSESQVTNEAASSGSTAGVRFMSPATSAGSQVTYERGSRSTTTDRFMSPGTSESQVAYKEFTDDEFVYLDFMPNSPVDQRLDLNADFVDDTGYPDTD